MIANIHEFLSFNEEMGVKDFIAKYSNDGTKSLGFGKCTPSRHAQIQLPIVLVLTNNPSLLE